MATFNAVTPEGLKHFYDTYVDPKFVKVDGVSSLTISADKVSYGNTNVKNALDSVNGKFTGNDAKNALALGGHGVDYFATADQVSAVTNNLTWRAPAADAEALKAIAKPQEGWTVSLADTNAIYRFDAANKATADDGTNLYVPADKTAGAWVLLSHMVYSNATADAAGLMSGADKAKLDGIDLSQYQTKIGDTLNVANVHLMGADSGIQLGGIASAQLHGKGGKIYYGEGTEAANNAGNEIARKSDIPASQDLSSYVKYNAEKDINMTDKRLTFTGGVVKNLSVTTGEGDTAVTTNYLFFGNMVNTAAEGEAETLTEKGLFASGGTVYYGGQASANELATKGDIANKVDKVNGKGLSTNDFTNEYKTKLDSLNEIQAATNDMIDAAMTAQA